MNSFDELAERLLREHDSRVPFTSVARAAKVSGIGSAYDIQDRYVHMLLTRERAAPAGYKIGLTSPRMQEMCGIGHPIGGVIFDTRIHSSGLSASLSEHVHLGVEFEIGVRLGRDIGADDLPRDVSEMGNWVDGLCPALELVEDRHADYRDLDVLSLIADNSWNAGAVLGPFVSEWPDLASVLGVVEQDGIQIDSGQGREVLGHPFEPLLWLARHLAERGGGLKAGQIVLTGSLVRTRFPSPGQHYRFSLEGIGSVEARFEP
jgi:2-keto-4-pentenoate hydratase